MTPIDNMSGFIETEKLVTEKLGTDDYRTTFDWSAPKDAEVFIRTAVGRFEQELRAAIAAPKDDPYKSSSHVATVPATS